MRSVSIASYGITAVLAHTRAARDGGPLRVHIDGDEVGVSSLRMQTFLVWGTRCAGCGVEGSHFRKERSHPSDPRPHLNLYAEVPGDVEALMTADHVHPRSRGGANSIENMQTMCFRCNGRKADSVTAGATVAGV